MRSDERATRFEREIETALFTFTSARQEHLVDWQEEAGILTIVPSKLARLGTYGLSVFCFVFVLFLWLLIRLLPLSPSELTTVTVLVLVMSSFLGCLGLLVFMQARRMGFVSLDIRNQTVHLQKIGLFDRQDILGITIRKNLWTERYRSQAIDTARDEDLKSTTVGIRFRKPIFLTFRDIGLITYRDIQDARSFQRALADVYECPLIER